MALSRRRFIAISAAFAVNNALPARAASLYEWQGQALGAEAYILLSHPEAEEIVAAAVMEIARLEKIFSLYQPDSALMQLNARARLEAPPFELLECLALSGRVFSATAGAFDPSIQPLWALYAESFAAGAAPAKSQIATTLARVGWTGLRFDGQAITMRAGMALTLNGIAQGFIADRIARMLQDRGLTNVLINTGELRALGGNPGGGAWPVPLATGGKVDLADRGMASSSVLGTTFDQNGKFGHILNPKTGLPAPATWQQVTISAPTAALADALSTAACLMLDRNQMEICLAAFPGARLETLVQHNNAG